jgi:hypothetical protein
MTTKRKTDLKIRLSNEAASALKFNQPSDNRLLEVLNGLATNGAATRPMQRWMAAQILGNYGYKLEV